MSEDESTVKEVEESIEDEDDDPIYEVVDGKTIVPLDNSITFGTTTIDKLEFQILTGKILRAMPPLKDGEVSFPFLLKLVGKLTTQAPSVIDMLEGKDVMAVIGVAANFLDGSLPIIPTSSAT